MMFAGVIFYSNILTELLNVLEAKIEKRNEITSKMDLLKKVVLEVKTPHTIQRQIKREVEYCVEFEAAEKKKKFIPVFAGVNQKDVDDLLYQAYTKKFDGTAFEGISDKKILIKFAQVMEEVTYEKRQIIYEIGDQARYFYLIK